MNKKNTKILLYFSELYSIPICKPLEQEILSQEYQVEWFCDNSLTIQNLPKEISVLQEVSDVQNYNPDIVLVSANTVPHFFPGVKVQIFHGFSVGKRSDSKGHFNIRGFFDLYCTQGPSTTVKFKELQKKHKYFQVVETGWSKMDPLFPLQSTTPDKTTIMICSTFTPGLSLAHNQEVVDEISRLSKLGSYHFITTLHPKMDERIVQKFKNLENKNFEFHQTTDLIPLYKQADIMLSDTTSAISEFALQKKPVVVINNNCPQDYMINISHASELESALKVALRRPEYINTALNDFISQTHPYSDGNSSKRVIDASINFLRNEKIKRKPMNLIRKYKICKRLRCLLSCCILKGGA